MGQPTDPKSYRNCLKFCTLATWVNTWGCFFHFLKNFIFGAHGTRWAQKVPKTLGQPRDLKRNRIFLYACFLSENLGDFFHFHYLKIFILGAHGTCLAQKGPFIFTYSMYHKSKARFPGHRVWGSRVKTPPCGIYYFRTWNLVNLINTSRKIDWTWSRDVKMTSWRKMTSHHEKWPLSRQNELFL